MSKILDEYEQWLHKRIVNTVELRRAATDKSERTKYLVKEQILNEVYNGLVEIMSMTRKRVKKEVVKQADPLNPPIFADDLESRN